ncbi:hypothetical protein [Deefgea sp. CFH1-16]|uniref:hypothetical protein n=1 Tax=Deefgea sp. CFH1-16 TaxID=2675457 RepID=UPI0015F4BBE1|nr:hypothetical protein [Deefgea sp. CFH1-16]MBM5573831.1 hypothetical protein [Deefgea sp. CFH1-16]
MSAEEHAIDLPQPEVPAHSVSFFSRYRLILFGVSGFFLVLIFFMIGIALGMAKKNFEKNFYLTQIEKLKDALSGSLEKRTELERDMTELKVELRAKKDHIAELEDKLAEQENATRRQELKAKDEGSAAVTTQANLAESTADQQSENYLRLKAGDCLVEGSAGATAANWRECLKKGKKVTAEKQSAAH